MQLGAIYIALGRPYLAMALLSASTLRKTNPSIPICIVTNVTRDVSTAGFWNSRMDSILFTESENEQGYFAKSKACEWSPFEATLFLDCDTIVLDDISAAQTFLRYFDVACTLLLGPPRHAGDVKIVDGLTVSELPHWNSGVIFFRRNARTRALFDTWQARYRELGVAPDQPALAAALFETDVRLLSLNADWNGYVNSLENPPRGKKIYHYMTRISPQLARMILEFDTQIGSDASNAAKSTAEFLRHRSDQMIKKIGRPRFALNRLLGRFY